jgi:hypothetical protein
MLSLGTSFWAALLSLFATGTPESLYVFGIEGRPVICVPKTDVPAYNRNLTHSSLSIVPGKSPVDLMTFQYNYPEVIRAIPRFNRNSNYRDDDPANTIFGGVSLIGDEYSYIWPTGIGAGRDVEFIWNRDGPCGNPVIVKVPRSSDYLARCTGALNDPEHVLHILYDRQPGVGRPPADIYSTVLARCTHLRIGFGPHKGVELEDCLREFVVGHFLIDYEFQIENAGVVPQMDAFLRSKIESWKRNCRHT